MSRVSDDRPYTANTTVTNVSGSPKRITPGAASVVGGQGDASSTVSATQKESHPTLHGALAKSKTLLSGEVYKALESATTDALALLAMMGTAGQPGPISSGASTIGGAGGVTDRQLRRKADSICRSLTELCLALNEENSRPRTSHGLNAAQTESPATPTVNGFGALNTQRRPSGVGEQTMARPNTSPRAMSRLEERRSNLLNGTALPSPRLLSSTLATPTEVGQGRRSSLLFSRRRATTEEPDEGRQTSLLRTRRAGTEEPEETRKPSLLLRPRRGTIGEGDDDDSRIRAPSRATAEVTPSPRMVSRDYSAPGAEPNSMTSSALPRRRLGPSTLNSRLAVPSSPATGTVRWVGDVNGSSLADKLVEERGPGPRPFSLGQTAMLNRTTSISRRNRDSMIMNGPGTPQTGSYR